MAESGSMHSFQAVEVDEDEPDTLETGMPFALSER